jgi:hypothetical protein
VRITLTVPDEVVAVIDAAAAREDRSRASQIRRTLVAHYAPDYPSPEVYNMRHKLDAGLDAALAASAADACTLATFTGNALHCQRCGREKGDH